MGWGLEDLVCLLKQRLGDKAHHHTQKPAIGIPNN